MRNLSIVIMLFIANTIFGQSKIRPSSSGKNAIAMPSITAMVSAIPPADSTIIVVSNYSNDADNIKTEWIYLASSTVTANGMTVLGTSGRFIMLVKNNKVTAKQLGVFPGFDNSTAFQTALNLTAAARIKLSVDANSTFRLLNVTMPSNSYLTGEDKNTSIIKMKDYIGNAQFMIGKNWRIGDSSNDITIDGITLDGNTKYALDTIASGTGAIDTANVIVQLLYTNRATVKNCIIKNGGNKSAILFYASPDLNISYNYFDSIGAGSAGSNYDSFSTGTYYGYNKIHHYGSRHHYDAQGTDTKVRNGEVWASFGSKNTICEYNEAWNDNLNRWFSVESRHTGMAIYRFNKYHSYGILSGGYSILGNINGGPLAEIVLDGNEDMDMSTFGPFRRKDSLIRNGAAVGLKKYDVNYDEFDGYSSLTIRNGKRNGIGMSFSNKAYNTLVENNVFNNINQNGNFFPGSGNFISIAIQPPYTDTVRNLVSRGNLVTFGAHAIRYLTLPSGGGFADGIFIDDDVFAGGDLLIGNIGNSKGNHSAIKIAGRWITTGRIFKAFSIKTVTQQVIDISKADFSRTNLTADTAVATTNLIQYTGGAQPFINRDGTRYANGIFKSSPTYIERTANYTATSADQTINCTANSFTIKLPTAVGIQGKEFLIKNTGTGIITIVTTNNQTIDNLKVQKIAAGAFEKYQSNKGNWIKIN
jgi:hypothetical protein